jgi:hypothetical protein
MKNSGHWPEFFASWRIVRGFPRLADSRSPQPAIDATLTEMVVEEEVQAEAAPPAFVDAARKALLQLTRAVERPRKSWQSCAGYFKPLPQRSPI